MELKRVSRLWIVVLLTIASVSVALLSLYFLRYSGGMEHLLSYAESLPAWVYFLLISIFPLFGAPISVFYIFAGTAYSWWIAALVIGAGLAVNMNAGYWIGRLFLRDWILRSCERRGWRIPEISDDNQFRITFLMRTVPGPPFVFQNYLLSVAGVSWPIYIVVSWSCQMVLAMGTVYLSKSVKAGVESGYGWWLLGIAILFVIFKIWMMWRKRRADLF